MAQQFWVVSMDDGSDVAGPFRTEAEAERESDAAQTATVVVSR